jgi:hypothetical protein
MDSAAGMCLAMGMIGFGVCLVAVAGKIEDAVRYYVDNMKKG